MTRPYYETEHALDAEWRTAFECAAALRVIVAALALEDDPYWVDELRERRAAVSVA